ncbi:MAG TPA: O-antigen ligase domain-containing protein [Prolixibacteraceae bacterium]|nr:O-antigen ligase domain-containing protein [Prolixibacteraceae bacterium]
MMIEKSPFESASGSEIFRSPKVLAGITIVYLLMALVLSKVGLVSGFALAGLPFLMLFVVLLFRFPIIGLYTAVFMAFVLLGIGRYVKGVPVGLALDALLIATYIALIFNRFYSKVDWSPAKKDITVLAIIWFGYSLFQIVNPEANSFSAWFSGRGIGLYMLLVVPLTLLFINSNQKLNIFLYLWGGMAILVTLKGIMQLQLGVDAWEKAWLDEGNYKTHILFGQLRAFSFLSDAGQFGANQAYSGVMATIMIMAMKNWKSKLFFAVVAVLSFYGMVISGTRGAISIPLIGFSAFFVLRKNKAVMLSGFFLLIIVFYFFKFTTIGQGNYQIRRMRSAFDTNDASFQVRLDNQRILRAYMASRPFGGGIGHGGVKAQKYLPNAYLSQIPTDSGYVLIWVEQGIVGLIMHLLILFYVVGKASYKIMFRIRDPNLKLKMAALVSGMLGIMVANYGNAVLYQMPTSILFYISMALIMNMKSFESEVPETNQADIYLKSSND